MEEFLKEAFKVERDLVRLSYWISGLEWGHYSAYAEDRANRARCATDDAITQIRALRSEVRIKEE